MPNVFQFYDRNLKRHGISRLEAIQVIEAVESEYFPLSQFDGHDRLMFVGFSDTSSCLLEVGVEFLPDNRERIFHANKARKYFINLYKERKRL